MDVRHGPAGWELPGRQSFGYGEETLGKLRRLNELQKEKDKDIEEFDKYVSICAIVVAVIGFGVAVRNCLCCGADTHESYAKFSEGSA